MESSFRDKFTWINVTSLLKSGELDPETNDVLQKLVASFSSSNKASGEQKPVFGVRELEEGHFIFTPSTIKQTKDEIIDFMQNQSSNNDSTVSTHKTTRSRDNSPTHGYSLNDAYVPLLEIPKGKSILILKQ